MMNHAPDPGFAIRKVVACSIDGQIYRALARNAEPVCSGAVPKRIGMSRDDGRAVGDGDCLSCLRIRPDMAGARRVCSYPVGGDAGSKQ